MKTAGTKRIEQSANTKASGVRRGSKGHRANNTQETQGMKPIRLSLALTACALGAGIVFAAQAATNETIVTVVKVTGISWFNRMDDGVKEFAKETGVNAYQTGPGRADAAQQAKIIEDLIAKKVSALAVVPYDPPTLEPVLKKAMDRGIKVVTHEADNAKNTMVDLEAFDNAAYGAALNDRLASCMKHGVAGRSRQVPRKRRDQRHCVLGSEAGRRGDEQDREDARRGQDVQSRRYAESRHARL
jgi:ABC-type sugar transport system substrate-binding protein